LLVALLHVYCRRGVKHEIKKLRFYEVFPDISRYFQIFLGISYYFQVFPDISCFWLSISLYFLIFHRISWYFIVFPVWHFIYPSKKSKQVRTQSIKKTQVEQKSRENTKVFHIFNKVFPSISCFWSCISWYFVAFTEIYGYFLIFQCISWYFLLKMYVLVSYHEKKIICKYFQKYKYIKICHFVVFPDIT
jgi:hypothetical protein